MSKAEERALEAFPEDIQLFIESQEEPGKWLPVDENFQLRYGYKRGYERAEKDTIERACQYLYEYNTKMAKMFGAKEILSCSQFTIDVEKFRKTLSLEEDQ